MLNTSAHDLAMRNTSPFVCILFLIVSFAVLNATVFGQKALESTEILWTKAILPTRVIDCRIEITNNDISPGEKDCSYFDHLKAGTKLFVRRKTKVGNWVKFDFHEVSGRSFEVFVDNSSGSVFRRAFGIFFSTRPVNFEYP